jgi:hypothetical protein
VLLAVRRALLPPAPHPGFELVGDPRRATVEPSHFFDRVVRTRGNRCRRSESAPLSQREAHDPCPPTSARRSATEVLAIDVVAEHLCDLLDIGDRQHHFRGVTVRHHEPHPETRCRDARGRASASGT